MNINLDVKSNYYYNQLLLQQSNAIKELNQLDQLMYETNNGQNQQHCFAKNNQYTNQNNLNQVQYIYHMQEKYPHLFQNQDSLFAPDNHNHWNYSNQPLSQYNSNQHPNNKSDKQISNNYNKNRQMHRNLNRQISKQKNERMHTQAQSKDNKNKGQNSTSEAAQNQRVLSKETKKQLQIFQEYLQSLQINQFLEVQSLIKKKQKLKTNNSQKNLQSSLQCTFKPSILKKSSQMAVNMQPSFQRLTMPVRNSTSKTPYKPLNKQIQKQYSKQRIQRLSKPRTLKTQPNQVIPIQNENQKMEYKKKSTFSLKPVSNVKPINYLDVAARNQLWQEQKQIKIEKLRRQQQENRAKKQLSTFAPKIIEYRGDKNVNLSNFAKEGLVNYFQRLSMAKSKNLPHNNSNAGKQNHMCAGASLGRKDSNSPYCSNSNSINNTQQNTGILSKTPKKQLNAITNQNKSTSSYNNNSIAMNNKKTKQRINYDQAVKQLHKKLMSLNI